MSTDNTLGSLFPSRNERVVLDFVLEDFPYPIALTYHRLNESLDQQLAVLAHLQLRDAFECMLKIIAGIAVADYLEVSPSSEHLHRLLQILLQKLSIGHWYDLIEAALKEPLESFLRQNRLGESGRHLPELAEIFFESRNGGRLRPTQLSAKLRTGEDNFVNWRNRIIGHGVSRDARWYAIEVSRWMGTLHDFYNALAPRLAGWSLRSLTPSGEEFQWDGLHSGSYAHNLTHALWEEPLSTYLVKRADQRIRLYLSPFLSIQRCRHCGQPASFFFDRDDFNSKRDRHRIYCVEYYQGHENDIVNWPDFIRLANMVPKGFTWQRTSYDQEEAEIRIRRLLLSFDVQFQRPEHLYTALEAFCEQQDRGYIYITSPGGMGKTYLVHGLERDFPITMLAYHIVDGALTDYRTFATVLAERARSKLRFSTQELQTNVVSADDLSAEFASYLTVLMSANRLESLFVAIDGLDVIPELDATTPTIADFLPPVDKLPEGCYLLLTSREQLQPRVYRTLERIGIEGQSSPRITKLSLDPDRPESRALIAAYLQQHLPFALRQPDSIAAIIERAQGVFLYAYHFAQALNRGVYIDVAALPAMREFYAAYLSQLSDRVGASLYESLYLQALALISAAYEPVTRDQLQHWGVPRERFDFALADLQQFLTVVPRSAREGSNGDVSEESAYGLGHQDFLAYLQYDSAMEGFWANAHAQISERILTTWQGRWQELQVDDPNALYDLRYLERHLLDAGRTLERTMLRRDSGYTHICYHAAKHMVAQGRALVGLDLASLAVEAFEFLASEDNDQLFQELLAHTLAVRADALAQLGRIQPSLDDCERLLSITTNLVEHRKVSGDRVAGLQVTAWHHKGMVLARLGRTTEALTAMDAAIVLSYQATNNDLEVQRLLQTVLINRGNTLRLIGRLDEAVEAYSEAVEVAESVVEIVGPLDFTQQALAVALTAQASAYFDVGNSAAAIEAHTQAIDILKTLITSGNSADAVTAIATAYVNRGIAWKRLKHTQEAARDFASAIDLTHSLVRSGEHTDLAQTVILALCYQAELLTESAMLPDALGLLNQAITLAKEQIDNGNSEAFTRLALAHDQIGAILLLDGRAADSLTHFSHAIEAWQAAPDAAVPTQKARKLRSLLSKISALLQFQDWSSAAQHLDLALSWLDPAWSDFMSATYVPGLDVESYPRDFPLLRREFAAIVPQLNQLPDDKRQYLVQQITTFRGLLTLLLEDSSLNSPTSTSLE